MHRLVGGVRSRGKTATNLWLLKINQVERFVQYKLLPCCGETVALLRPGVGPRSAAVLRTVLPAEG
jgi:hypothetical protein